MFFSKPSLGIYIHWPFCLSKCWYCDFNTYVNLNIDYPRWEAALLHALDYASLRTQEYVLVSIFFGGGTPSLMDPTIVSSVIDCVTTRWLLSDNFEATLEVNPNTINYKILKNFRLAGINRLSLGIQALDENGLYILDRTYDANKVTVIVDYSKCLFTKLSLDLIYNRPGQVYSSWRRELRKALSLCVDHLSLYQLTLNTKSKVTFFQKYITLQDLEFPDDFYRLTHKVITRDLPAYEISNHAKPGSECLHNLNYWQSNNTIGVGPGAHGRLTVETGITYAACQHSMPNKWLVMVENGDYSTYMLLSQQERFKEVLLMGLRITRGINCSQFFRLTGHYIQDFLNAENTKKLGRLISLNNTHLRVSLNGRPILNQIINQLLN